MKEKAVRIAMDSFPPVRGGVNEIYTSTIFIKMTI